MYANLIYNASYSSILHSSNTFSTGSTRHNLIFIRADKNICLLDNATPVYTKSLLLAFKLVREKMKKTGLWHDVRLWTEGFIKIKLFFILYEMKKWWGWMGEPRQNKLIQ